MKYIGKSETGGSVFTVWKSGPFNVGDKVTAERWGEPEKVTILEARSDVCKVRYEDGSTGWETTNTLSK